MQKELKTIGIIVRDGKKYKISELPQEERERLAQEWNKTAMKEAGYIPCK